MTRNPALLLNDILESIHHIETYTRGLDEEAFAKDTQAQDAVIRRFEIIGEAVKALPDDVKQKNPKVRWNDIAGLRDVLIHGYHRVNIARVWQVIEDDLADLSNVIQSLIEDLSD